MSQEIVLTEARGPVSWIIFNRPEVYNAFNLDLAKGAFSALVRAVDDPATRVIVFAGAGKSRIIRDAISIYATFFPGQVTICFRLVKSNSANGTFQF